MALLSFSGGIIYLLPFLQEVYYIPLSQAMGLSNTEVGWLMGVFGITSLIGYFPGGWLADRISPRKLITLSLLTTGSTGLYFSTFPAYEISLILHAIWGLTTAFLFWSAMIRITRNWAPPEEQGRAFGILEGGRGIGEAVPSVAFLAVFAALGSGDVALSMVIIQFSATYLFLGVLAWFVLDDKVDTERDTGEKHKVGLQDILHILRMPIVWLIATVILTGYSAYWGLFRYTSYATEIFGLSVTFGATISIGKMWLKPVAPIIAGFIGDKFGIARSVAWLFVILIASYSLVAVLPGNPAIVPVMILSLAIGSLTVFAMRGIYFALLEEGGVPLAVTGTATGVISAIAFTPDIFMPVLGGVLLDSFPGAAGYRYFFFTTAAMCGVGLAATLTIYFKIVKRRSGVTET
jgi:sugar phosphate permease